MHEETVYDALDAAHGGEGQWAFGTGFDEAGVGVVVIGHHMWGTCSGTS